MAGPHWTPCETLKMCERCEEDRQKKGSVFVGYYEFVGHTSDAWGISIRIST